MTAERQTARLTGRMKAFGEAATYAIGGAAVAMDGFVKAGYSGAVNQIDAMTTASLNFNASLKQSADLQNLISDTSNSTAQSFKTTADMASTMAQLSFTVDQTKQLFPTIARAADLMQFLSGGKTNPVEATKDIGQMSHLYGVYDTKGVAEIARLLVGLSKTQPESLSKVVTQSKYFAPLFSALGVSVGESLAVTAGMGIMGFLRSKGGTSAAGAILGGISATTITGHLAKAQARADQQSHLGLMDSRGRAAFYNYQTKSFDIAGMIQHLANVRNRYDATPALGGQIGFAKDLTAAFGKSAVPYLLASLRPDTIKQVAIAQANMRKENIATDYAKELSNPKFVQQLLGTNFLNTLSDAFTPLVKTITPWMVGLAGELGKLDKIVRAHPTQSLFASIGLGISAFALTLAAAWKILGPILSLGGVVTKLKAIPPVAPIAAATGGGTVESAAGKGIIGRIVAGVAGVAAARATNWGAVGNTLKKAWNVVPRTIGEMHGPLKGVGFVDSLEGASRFMKGIFPAIGSRVSAFLRPLEAIGARLASGGVALRLFGGVVGRIGIQFIPVVNVIADIIMGIQLLNAALGYFKTHPKEIGTWIGNIVGYIRYHLIPDTVKIVQSWGPLIGSAFHTIVQFMLDMLNPAKWTSNFSGLTDAMKSAYDAGVKAMHAQYASTQPAPRVVVPSYVRPPAGSGSAGGTHHHDNRVSVTVNGADHASADALANHIAKKVSAANERKVTRAVAIHGGMMSSPIRQQMA